MKYSFNHNLPRYMKPFAVCLLGLAVLAGFLGCEKSTRPKLATYAAKSPLTENR